MFLKKMWQILLFVFFLLYIQISEVLAKSSGSDSQDVLDATNDFSTKMLAVFKGPVVKILAGVVLFMGVGGLLRGKHQVAVCCAAAFILLLFLPIILQYFGG